MSALRGIIAGTIGLSFLEAVVSSQSAAKNTGALFDLAASAMNRLVDPSVPLIPDRRAGHSGSGALPPGTIAGHGHVGTH